MAAILFARSPENIYRTDRLSNTRGYYRTRRETKMKNRVTNRMPNGLTNVQSLVKHLRSLTLKQTPKQYIYLTFLFLLYFHGIIK